MPGIRFVQWQLVDDISVCTTLVFGLAADVLPSSRVH